MASKKGGNDNGVFASESNDGRDYLAKASEKEVQGAIGLPFVDHDSCPTKGILNVLGPETLKDQPAAGLSSRVGFVAAQERGDQSGYEALRKAISGTASLGLESSIGAHIPLGCGKMETQCNGGQVVKFLESGPLEVG